MLMKLTIEDIDIHDNNNNNIKHEKIYIWLNEE